MSRTFNIEGVDLTESQVQDVARLLRSPAMTPLLDIVVKSQAAAAEQGMSLDTITDRQLWECRGAYMQLRRLVSVFDAIRAIDAEIVAQADKSKKFA